MSIVTNLKDKIRVLKSNGYTVKVVPDGTSTKWVATKGTKMYTIDDAIDIVLLSKLDGDGVETQSTTPQLQFSGLKKITVGPTAPVSPSVGDLWFRTEQINK
jgi:uncharacterized protein (DUF4213/DUF364 family)